VIVELAKSAPHSVTGATWSEAKSERSKNGSKWTSLIAITVWGGGEDELEHPVKGDATITRAATDRSENMHRR
jgi:hypothetical protein